IILTTDAADNTHSENTIYLEPKVLDQLDSFREIVARSVLLKELEGKADISTEGNENQVRMKFAAINQLVENASGINPILLNDHVDLFREWISYVCTALKKARDSIQDLRNQLNNQSTKQTQGE
ncbi:MAG: hypothetical protein ACXADH_14890, partial [Candidatus Kariarchaeaceae archaeon]